MVDMQDSTKECLTGLTGEDLVAAEEALAEQSAEARKALEANEQGVLDEFDRVMAMEGQQELEELRKSEAQRTMRALLEVDTQGERDKLTQQVRELLSSASSSERQAEVLEMEAVVTAPKRIKLNRNHMHQRVFKNKMSDKRGKLFGFRGFGVYAVDKATARELMELRTEVKPRWAVIGLVLLRDTGECQVCGGLTYGQGEVKQLVPVMLGGQFSEPNCVSVCKDCAKAWPSKNFFISEAVEFHFWELCAALLKRRMLGKGNTRPLTAKGLEQFDKIRTRIDRALVAMNKTVDEVFTQNDGEVKKNFIV